MCVCARAFGRPEGVVVFGDSAEQDKMAGWSRGISRLLDVVEEAGYLLEKEKLMQSTLMKRKVC